MQRLDDAYRTRQRKLEVMTSYNEMLPPSQYVIILLIILIIMLIIVVINPIIDGIVTKKISTENTEHIPHIRI